MSYLSHLVRLLNLSFRIYFFLFFSSKLLKYIAASVFLGSKVDLVLNGLIWISILSFLKCHFKRSILPNRSSSNFNLATSNLFQVVIKLRPFGKREISFSVSVRLDKLIFLMTNLPFNQPSPISVLLLCTFEDGVVSQLLEFSESLILESSNIVFVSESSNA